MKRSKPTQPKGHNRNRLPTSVKQLRGTVEKSRLNKFEPQAEMDLSGEPPHWMTDLEQRVYSHSVTHAPRGLLKELDRNLLEGYCRVVAAHREAHAQQVELDRHSKMPMLIATETGFAISPYVKLMDRLTLLMVRLGSELGFSPASRPRIALIPGAAPPPLIEGEVALDPWQVLERAHKDAA